MDLRTARALRVGDRIVARITDTGLAGYAAGGTYVVHSNDPAGADTRWLTFDPEGSRRAKEFTGRHGLSDYALADHFDLAGGR